MHLLFDIGGTKTRISSMKAGADKFSMPRVVETPYMPEDVVTHLLSYGKEVGSDQDPVVSIAGGIAGTVNQAGVLMYAPNIPNWLGKNLGDIFGRAAGVPVTLLNDAMLAAIGEARFGAGRGFRTVAYITVGTGVGGACVVNGRPEQAFGYEVGHQIIDLDGSLLPDSDRLFPGRKGELETLVGGAALKAEVGMNPKDVTDKSVWNDLAERLAAGVYNTILHWKPDAVVFGGSMILGDPAISVEAVELKAKKRARPIMAFPAFKKAELKDFGVIHGALAVVQTTWEKVPV